MSTVEAVSGDVESVESAAGSAGVVVPPEQRVGADGSALGTSQPRPVSADAGADRRALLVPVLTAVVVALITGVIVLAVVGFNVMLGEFDGVRAEVAGLRDDMNAEIAGLRDDMDARFAQVDARFAQVDARFAQVDARFAQMDARFAQMDARFGEVHAVLLDHTDRLARIEAIHGAHSHVSAETGAQG